MGKISFKRHRFPPDVIAKKLKAKRPPPSPRWHLDEMVCNVGGKRMYLWRAIDDEGEMLDMVMRPSRDVLTTTRFLANLLLTQPVYPERIPPTVWDHIRARPGGCRLLTSTGAAG